tara:strand:+ start:2102 stop:2614 length:513 start_codon:yes stop_codon:yes gene_type:complete
MSDIKIFDNFLNKQDFKKLFDSMNGNSFPWYYNDYVNDKENNNEHFQFIHNFFNKTVTSNLFTLVEPLTHKLDMTSIVRIKANLLLKTDTPVVHDYHTDFNWKYKWWTAVYYVNSNNGKTIFKKNKESVCSKANRLVLFDGRLLHKGTTATDSKKRICINLNFFNKQLEK